MGIFSTLPFVLGAGANVAGGFLSDLLVRKYGLRRGQWLIGAAALSTASLLVLATALTSGKLTGVILISLDTA